MYALKTHHWKDALALQLPAGAEPSEQAITFWARAIAAGHLRDFADARDAVQQYDNLVDAVRKSSRPYIRSVADKQDAEGKGEVELPAREMLANMFLGMNRPAESLAEYEQSLKTDRNRVSTVSTAPPAPRNYSNNHTPPPGYYVQLLKNCEAAPSERPELSHAKELGTMK